MVCQDPSGRTFADFREGCQKDARNVTSLIKKMEKGAKKQARRAMLLRRQLQWRAGTRRVYLSGILDEQGQPFVDEEAAAAHLQAHWQSVFDTKPIQRQAIATLRRHVPRLRSCRLLHRYNKHTILSAQ